ncbi:hypothetical protein ANCDUO_03972 [Ancylostoma duodenale]|uniref:Uncharacterized protein n=1 Tax=Ancylostoma duodenale TaxID=51022 RepID=A0A0C2D7S1_9BILA|nr:hypothetical protein ANCDUO_03972 [Ancylostoma duodenale]
MVILERINVWLQIWLENGYQILQGFSVYEKPKFLEKTERTEILAHITALHEMSTVKRNPEKGR